MVIFLAEGCNLGLGVFWVRMVGVFYFQVWRRARLLARSFVRSFVREKKRENANQVIVLGPRCHRPHPILALVDQTKVDTVLGVPSKRVVRGC